jgi:hypothetical protein
MRLAGAFAGLAIGLLPSCAQAACPLTGSQNFARLAELPQGAAAALGFRMAERGARFEATDNLGPAPRPPSSRFIVARRNGCTIALRYEQGGIAHTYETAVLEMRGNAWVLVRRR